MLLFIAPKVSELRGLNKAVFLASNYFSVMDTLGFGSKTKKSTPGETIGTVEKSYLRTWGWNQRNYSVSFIVQGCFCVCVRALCNTAACWWDDGARLIAKPDICISAHKITHKNINGKQNLKQAKRDRKRLVVRGDKMRSRRVSASWWMRVACQGGAQLQNQTENTHGFTHSQTISCIWIHTATLFTYKLCTNICCDWLYDIW